MKTGIELIAQERKEQIEKHERTIKNDILKNGAGQLLSAAIHILGRSSVFDFDGTEDFVPVDWQSDIYNKMNEKGYKQRLIIAGALIAAEIDRISPAPIETIIVDEIPIQEVEESWEFWKDIILNEDGTINIEQLKKELSDFYIAMKEVGKVYCHITNDRISKINTFAAAVIGEADDCYRRSYEEQPIHSQYDILKEDKVYIDNSDGSIDYFIVAYEEEGAQYVLIPFTDQTFSTPKETNGRVVVEPLNTYGFDLLNRWEEI